MEEYNRYTRIADSDPVKLARMLEIQSWFDKDQLAATATSMAKYLQQSEKAAILLEGVTWEYIELHLWAMEQTDSPNSIMRERWWLKSGRVALILEVFFFCFTFFGSKFDHVLYLSSQM